MMKDIESYVIENTFVGGKTYKLTIGVDGSHFAVKPGQFLMIRPSTGCDPLLRRAFAIADFDNDKLSIFYDVVGKGTRILSGCKKGDKINVLLPLGKGYFPTKGEEHVIIGGGIGIAGLILLGKELLKQGKKITIVYGAKSKEFLSMVRYIRENFENVVIFTEDGSEGFKGLVTDVIRDLKGSEIIHACGPKPMLRALNKLAEEFKIFLSLETPMACGWGVCLGCVVKGRKGFVRTCYEGPVFEASEVEL